MKLILLGLLSVLCLSTQKEFKNTDDVKKIIDKCGWFKQKQQNPIIIKVSENNIVSIETKANDASESSPGAAGDIKEETPSSSLVSVIKNANNLAKTFDDVQNLETGVLLPISETSDVVEGVTNSVKEVFDGTGIAQADQAPISALLNSADEIIKQPLMMSQDVIHKSSAQGTGRDSDIRGQTSSSDAISTQTILPAMLKSTKQQAIIDETQSKSNENGLSPAVQTHLLSPLLQTNPSMIQTNPASIDVTTQLQALPSTIPIDIKPKLQINPPSVINQPQQDTDIRSSYNQQSSQALKPQRQSPDFIFGDFFNVIPKMVIPQIQQAIPQFVPPIVYPILPKILTPILPPIISNIFFPVLPSTLPQQDKTKNE